MREVGGGGEGKQEEGDRNRKKDKVEWGIWRSGQEGREVGSCQQSESLPPRMFSCNTGTHYRQINDDLGNKTTL